MIIKIEIDDGIGEKEALASLKDLMDYYRAAGARKIHHKIYGIDAQITKHSKAGNIFIHVSKAERKAA